MQMPNAPLPAQVSGYGEYPQPMTPPTSYMQSPYPPRPYPFPGYPPAPSRARQPVGWVTPTHPYIGARPRRLYLRCSVWPGPKGLVPAMATQPGTPAPVQPPMAPPPPPLGRPELMLDDLAVGVEGVASTVRARLRGETGLL